MPDTEIQELARSLPFEISEHGVESSMRFSIMNWATASKDLVPPYWSQARDNFLRHFYYDSDPIKITVGTFIHKVTDIPISVVPKDRSVNRHVFQSRVLNENLLENSGLFAGLRVEME